MTPMTGYARSPQLTNRPTQAPMQAPMGAPNTFGMQPNPNRTAIAGLMGGHNSPGVQGTFGIPDQFGTGASPYGMGPPGQGQMPIPPSLNFQPGVGTSSPAMTNWRPPQYGAPPPNMNSNPMLQPGAPNFQQRPIGMGPTTR